MNETKLTKEILHEFVLIIDEYLKYKWNEAYPEHNCVDEVPFHDLRPILD